MRTIKGGKGNDTITGTQRDDWIEAGDGNDLVNAGLGNDWLHGGNGNDLLHGQDGNDNLYGHGGADTLWGEAGNDNLDGGDGNDTLYGGDGDDWLQGRNGDDIMYGGAGNDTLELVGNDTAYGDSGIDRFVLNDNRGFTSTIMDFDAATEALWRPADANASSSATEYWFYAGSSAPTAVRNDGNGQATVSFDGQYTTLTLYHADGDLNADATVLLLGQFAPQDIHVMLINNATNTYFDGLIFP